MPTNITSQNIQNGTPFPAWRLPNGINKASDSALERAASSCETWAISSGLLVVLGLIVEAVIAFVHPAYDSLVGIWTPFTADVLVALGVAGEVLFSMMSLRRHDELRIRSNTKLADALVQAGEANARASEAQLALEKYKTPRRLTAETRSQIADKLKPFSETTFVMSAVGPEPIDLAIDTANALIAAGWQWKDWRGVGAVSNIPGGHSVGSVALNGTAVKGFHPEVLAAIDALVKALDDVPEFEGVRDISDNVQHGTPSDIVIMIGTKR